MKRSDSSAWRKDGNLSFQGGVNAAIPASDISREEVESAVNANFRGGTIKPRYAYTRRVLTYGANLAKPFQRGLFQGGWFYSDEIAPMLICAISGRIFKIDISTWNVTDITPLTQPNTEGRAITKTTANVTMPAVGANVAIHVVSTTGMTTALPSVLVAGMPMKLISVDSGVQFTAQNNTAPNVGLVMGNPVTVNFSLSQSGGTLTTAPFTIPAVNGTVVVPVADTSRMVAELTMLKIGGYALTLVSIDSATQITVSNAVATQVGIVVGTGSPVLFYAYDISNPTNTLAWGEQAENYFIVQDNQSYAAIFNGSESRRANPVKSEVPVGNVMCYTQGRLTVALPGHHSFRIGDLVFGASGSPGLGYIDALLRFTENDYLNEGGDFVARVFGAPSNVGPILSMKAGAMTDTQLGQGPLVVGTPYCVFTVQLPFDRTTWKNLSQALQTVNLINGPLGQESTVLINTDLWYRAVDGWRSMILARRDFSTSWGNTPQSAELGEVAVFDTQRLLEHGSGVNFDNRMLQTVSPVDSANGVWHRGLVSLDFNLISSSRKKTPPAWEGVWTGQRFLKVVKGMVNKTERCFMFVLSADNHIELWELDPTAKFDDGDQRIQWSVNLPSYNCGDSDNFKKLEAGRLVIDGLVGQADGTVKYMSDLGPCFQAWDTFSVCAKHADCGPPECAGPHTYREQQRTPIRLKAPPDDWDDTENHRLTRTGFEFQPRLEITGWFEIRAFRAYCLDAPEQLGVEKRDAT